MSDEVARIITDLLTTEPAYVNVTPPPYDAWETYEEKVARTLSCLRRATYLGQRTETLVMAYYLGQLVERTEQRNCLTSHYRLGSLRIYYLFQRWGMEQIYRTEYVTFNKIKRLSAREYRVLVE